VGIAAPKSIPVYREEIWAAITAENAEGAKAPAPLPDARPGRATSTT
jgi:carbon storage regulator